MSRMRTAARVVLAVVAGAGVAVVALPGSATAAAARGFELVSPAGSDAYDATGIAVRPGGETMYWSASGGVGDPSPPDAGATDVYGAARAATGWASSWLTNYQLSGVQRGTQEVMPGMTSDGVVFDTTDGIAARDQNAHPPFPVGFDFYRGTVTGTTLLSAAPGQPTGPAGVASSGPWTTTPGLEATLFQTNDNLLPGVDGDAVADVYLGTGSDLTLVSHPSPTGDPAQSSTEAFVAVSDDPHAGYPGSQGATSLSDDGRSALFVTAGKLDPADTDTADDLYLWHDGQVSIVSDGVGTTQCQDPGPPAVDDCNLAVRLQGMSHDASRVYFSTAERLLDADTDGFVDVYAYDAGSGTLELATPGTDQSDAYTVTVARDGDLFYLAGDGVAGLSLINPEIHRWDGAGTVPVAPLGSGDASNPAVLAAQGNIVAGSASTRPVRATADGHALLFATTAQLDPGLDHDALTDLYLWRDGSGVTLVSAGGSGTYPVGLGASDPGTPLVGTRFVGRNIKGDGSRVFFTTADALTSGAGDNGRSKVYEWGASGVHLLSPAGIDAEPATYLDSTDSGDDVFFATRQSLVSADADVGQLDVYDARIGGGFADDGTTSSIGAPVAGGGPGQVPAPPAIGSQSPAPEPPAKDDTASAPQKPANEPSAQQVSTSARLVTRNLTAGSKRLSIRVKVSSAGTVTARLRRARTTLARGKRTFGHAGTVKVSLKMTKKARAVLRDGRRHRFTIRVMFRPRREAQMTRSYRVVVRHSVSHARQGRHPRRGRRHSRHGRRHSRYGRPHSRHGRSAREAASFGAGDTSEHEPR